MKRLILFLLLISATGLSAQIDYEYLSRAQKYKLDTFAFDNAKKVAGESIGIIEREIEPDEYIVGPEDKFIISVLLAKTLEYPAKVSPEGWIMLQEAGAVDVKGKTLTQAKELIYNQIKKYFNTDNIFILLDEVRKFKITVSGSISKPISVTASATDRVSDAIDRAGGLTYDASFRNISIKRKIGYRDTIINVDLVRYYMLGDTKSNPYLTGGDVITIPPSNEKDAIKIYGDVSSPGEFEYKEGDSLSTLIRMAQCFLKSAFLDSVEFARFDKSNLLVERTFLNLNSWRNINSFSYTKMQGDFVLQTGDRLFVRSMPDWNKMDYVIITGEVRYPGKYAIEENKDRFADVIKRAGGLTADASAFSSELIRQNDKDKLDLELERLKKIPQSERSRYEQRYYDARINERRGIMSIDFDEAINNYQSEDNIYLMNKDSIIVPQKINYINIQGRVNKPGNVNYSPGMTYLDYINIAGGYGYRADQKETLVRKQRGEIFLAKGKDYTLEPGDVILVPTKKEIDLMDGITTWVTLLAQFATFAGVIIALTK